MAGTTQVTITHGWAVYAHGEQHSGGQTVEVDDDLANQWVSRGWATTTGQTAKRASRARRTPTP